MQKEAKQAHEDPDRAYAEEVDEHGAEGKPRSRGRGKGRGKGRGRGRGRKAKGDPPKGSGKADPESMEAGEREKDEEDVEENEALPAGKRAKTKQLPRKRATSKEGDADPHAKKAKPDSSAAAARQDEHEDWCISIVILLPLMTLVLWMTHTPYSSLAVVAPAHSNYCLIDGSIQSGQEGNSQ